MKAGFFETDITPAPGMERPGGYLKSFLAGVRHPLKVRAGVFDDGGERVALVGIDTCTVPKDVVAEARRRIAERAGIGPAGVLVAASHTHSGGPLFGREAACFEDAPELVRQIVARRSEVDPQYAELCTRQIAGAVCEADRRREEAHVSFGRGHEEEVVHNRRFVMKSGRTYTHPGKGNPDIVKPAGPIDPEVGVVGAFRPDGKLLGCVVNYACHGTTMSGDLASSDWIHYLCETVGAVMGRGAVTVFLNGACADVTQVDNLSMGKRESGEHWARKVGIRVGAEVIKVLATAPAGDARPVASASRTLKLERRRPSAETLRECRRIVTEGMKDGPRSAEWLFASEKLLLEFLLESEPAVDAEVQAVQVGPAVFLANPAEYFCQLGLDIKRSSRFPFTFVVELAGGDVGYVPTEEAFGPSGGGYETILTAYSNLEPGAGGRIAEASVGLADSLEPGTLPEAKRLEEPGTPWTYGTYAPEVGESRPGTDTATKDLTRRRRVNRRACPPGGGAAEDAENGREQGNG